MIDERKPTSPEAASQRALDVALDAAINAPEGMAGEAFRKAYDEYMARWRAERRPKQTDA